MFNFLFLLPSLLDVGKDVAKCLDGGMTQQEYEDLLDSLGNLITKVPALAGFMAIFQSVLKIARVAYPMLQEIKNVKPSAIAAGEAGAIKMGAAKKEIDKILTKDDMLKAERSIRLLSDLSVKMASDKGVPVDAKSKKTLDTDKIFFQSIS
jgi:hypothetical protein